jgi:dihydropteroate synthase
VRKRFTIQVNGIDYILGRQTWIMGILNVTPDSFSDGGLYLDKEKAIKHGMQLIEEGADILDVGGESTRPGSDTIPVEEEIRRIIPVITEIRKNSDTLISVDTTKSEVSRRALDAGADILNDISALRLDQEVVTLAAERKVPVILMHMKGSPKTMQVNPSYDNLLEEIKSFFEERVETVRSLGIQKEKIIVDPGIGFGKGLHDNLFLIKNLHFLEELDLPVLLGVSRKAFIGQILDLPAEERIEGTIASALLGILNGAHILRVHDVAAVKRAVQVAEAIMNDDSPCDLQNQTGVNKRSYV